VVVNVDPDGALSRSTARYSLADFGFVGNTLRTVRAWKAARDAGRLQVEYRGVQPIPECGGRACHLLVRTCDPPEVDNFSLADRGVRDPARFPAEAQTTIRLMLDAETWLQVGSEATHADGTRIGEYFFRDIVLNPSFPPGEFRLR
jgi:outer membrane lipoprotein-sorting protein